MQDNPVLDKSDFEAATGNVSGLNFRNQDFRGARAPENACFENCDFSGSDLSGTDLSGLTFDNCLLQQANLRGAILVGCVFQNGTSLFGAHLEGVDATSAKFLNSDMEGAEATGGTFLKSSFKGTKLTRAIFDRADLSDAESFEPDKTSVYRAIFSGGNLDRWTALRFEYTGLKLFLSLLPPIIFIISLLAEAYVNLGASYYLANANGSSACGENGSLCETFAIWQIVLGQREGPLAVAFVIYSTVYNLARFALTMAVSSLAAAEDRSRVTPPLKGLRGIQALSVVATGVKIAKYGMLLLFAVNMWNLAVQTVVLPKS